MTSSINQSNIHQSMDLRPHSSTDSTEIDSTAIDSTDPKYSKKKIIVLTIQLSDGTRASFGSRWFDGQAFEIGSKVKFKKHIFESEALWGTAVKYLNDDMGNSFLNNRDQEYEVVKIGLN